MLNADDDDGNDDGQFLNAHYLTNFIIFIITYLHRIVLLSHSVQNLVLHQHSNSLSIHMGVGYTTKIKLMN